jgi:hypothetical protein
VSTSGPARAPPKALRRVTLAWDILRTESTAAHYLDLLRGASGRVIPPEHGEHGDQDAGCGLRRALELGAALAGSGPRTTGICARIGLPLDQSVRLRQEIRSVFEPTLALDRSRPAPSRVRAPTLVALVEQSGGAADRAQLAAILGAPEIGPRDTEALRQLFQDTGARSQVEERITGQTSRARRAIATAPLAADARAALDALAVSATSPLSSSVDRTPVSAGRRP